MEHARIEAGDAVDATLFRQDSVPEILDTGPDACDRADTCNDCASFGLMRSPCLTLAST